MSAPGSPGGLQKWSKPIPPQRGSFPLDHDAECQPIMKQYLRCIRSKRGVNDEECRELSKNYLQCRMERNLMAPDSMRNLGFHDETESTPKETASTSSPTAGTSGTDNVTVASKNEQTHK